MLLRLRRGCPLGQVTQLVALLVVFCEIHPRQRVHFSVIIFYSEF